MDTHFHFSGLITHMFPKLTIQGQWSTVQVEASGPTGHHRLTSLPPQWFLWTHSILSLYLEKFRSTGQKGVGSSFGMESSTSSCIIPLA